MPSTPDSQPIYEEVIGSPPTDNLFPTPHDTSQDASRASSIRGIGATSSASTISESGQSESSLGGLNHVNDGVQGSTTQRRMSRVYSSHDDLLAQGQNQGHARGHSENSIHRRNPAIAEEPGHNNNNQDDNDDDDDDGPSPGERKSESCWKTWLRKRVPAYGWLISPGYNYHELPDDLIAGITISTVVIPQSMAYAMLAQLPPVYGLYTSVVPILVYCIFGTSRHMHTGTFAITTLLLGQAVRGLIADRDSSSGRQGNPPTLNDYNLINVLFYEPSPLPPPEDSDQEQYYIGMILMLSLVIGVVQVIMAFMRVGGWASKHLLPDALVGGFNTAAVFHIGTSQLKHFLGLKGEPKLQGAFALIKSWIWIGSRFWSDTNWYTVTLGTTAILFMLALRSLEKKRKAKYELKLRAKEMQSVQQRQAVSAAIVRDHEERRLQQQAWLQQHQQKQATEAFPSSSTTTRDPTTVPFFDSNSSTGGAASTISLRTVPDEDGNRRPTRGSGVNSRSPSEAEQATMDAVVSAAVVAKEERQVYVPIPDILLAVIVMTLLTVFFSLDTPRSEGGFGIAVIGTIPKGLPQIAFPPSLITTGGAKEWMTWEFVTEVVLPMIQPALLIAVIIYVMSYSIGKQFGKRYGYKVDADQEMLALGLASIIGSSFSGYACTGSLTRTAILSQSGGKTPLASIVGVVTVVLTLIYLTWCFERVPNAVLAAIVLIALQSLVMQITEPLKLWRLGQRKAALIWSVTFLGVLVVSVELGIAIGIFIVLCTTAYSWVVNRRSKDARRRHSHGHGDLDQDHESTESLLNPQGTSSSSAGRWRGGNARNNGVHLTAGASPAERSADWRRRMLRTQWGQRIGSFLGMDRPIFSDSLHTNTDEDEY